ncbi:MAG: tRNA (adenosine(37)-N6)-threonylcarbamoyltransferase complex dimerization subunit type 1 TsaB [Clostridia bacterium]|jgi:tRNA threonylcarbamoyl adenosine modification protein YeaZ|nr:tRNA (adenosine(37)-N6)-threonylcarbamoyltransferase complex dimerization subunit type 1 TsaB [Clostridia bacterium]
MKILCINTAFAEAHIAFKNESIQIFRKINAEAKSSENILPAIEKVLYEQSISPKELTYIATVVGPGSFTGIRIGTAIAKGSVCTVPTIKLIAINSLDLMAYEFLKNKNSNERQNVPQVDLSNDKNPKTFYCIQNAHSKRFFIAKYNFVGERISDYALVNKLPENAILIKLECEDFEIPPNFVFDNSDNVKNSSVLINIKLKPETLLEVALKYIEEIKITDLQNFEPVYIRLSQAEENLIKSKCKKS